MEGGVVSGFVSNNPKKTVNSSGLQTMADTHSASLPKARHDDDIVIPSQFSWPGNDDTNHENVIDTINHNHELKQTQSMPVWMPSVVATTINEKAEEQAFGNLGDISLDELRDDVNTAYSPPAPGMVFLKPVISSRLGYCVNKCGCSIFL